MLRASRPTLRNKALLGCAGMRRGALALLMVLVLAGSANAQQNLTWDTNGVAAGTGGTGYIGHDCPHLVQRHHISGLEQRDL